MNAPQPEFPFAADCFNLFGEREEMSVPDVERNDASGGLWDGAREKGKIGRQSCCGQRGIAYAALEVVSR